MKRVGFGRSTNQRLDNLNWGLFILMLISGAALCISIATGAPLWLDVVFGGIVAISHIVGTILDSIT